MWAKPDIGKQGGKEVKKEIEGDNSSNNIIKIPGPAS